MLSDPRQFPSAALAPAELARCYDLVHASLGATARAESEAHDAQLTARLSAWMGERDGEKLAQLVDLSPSVDVHRHLARLLARAMATTDEGQSLAVTLFAIPVVLVAAVAGGAGQAVLSGVLPDATAIASILKGGSALAGNRTLAVANAMVGAAAIEVSKLPALHGSARLPGTAGAGFTPLALAPAPLAIAGGLDAAHLRFLVGTALAAPGADLVGAAGVGQWGMPLAEALSTRLRVNGVTLTAIPRPIQPLATAVQAGRSAQREVSATLFASNALRRLRASFGEPTAVISAHRLADGRGELRLSLSTPFDTREAEGFRCPLHPGDRVGDVATMLIDLLRDCRLADIRVVDGAHADRDPATGLTLLFKPDTIPPAARVALH